METEFISSVVLPVVFIVVGIALVWALVELIMFMRRTSKTIANIEDQVHPILADAKDITESLKPAVDRIDPLVERASLAVDAANLEIMRLDGILEDVNEITTTASQAVSAVDTVAQTPMRLVNDVSEKLRGAFRSKKASAESIALGEAGERAASGLGEGSAAAPVAPEAPAAPVAPVAPETPADDAAAPASEPAPVAQASAGESEQKSAQYFTY